MNMKKIFGFWNLLLMASASLFMVSCGDDTDDPIDVTSPTVTETHTFDASVGQDPVQPIVFTIKAVKGVGKLASLNIKENGSNLATSRFTIDGDTEVSSTVALLGSDQDGFTKTVSIIAPSTSGKYTYLFTVTDANQKSDDVSLEVTIAGVTTITSEKVYNLAGPLSSGLNLSDGKAVAKNTDNNTWPGAHILDAGNDLVGSNPVTYPWKGSINGYDGSVIRKTSSANWTAVIGQSQIKSYFDSSSDVATAKLVVGDVYVVKKNDDYFMIRVKSVVDDGEDGGGTGTNLDYSEFDIKQAN